MDTAITFQLLIYKSSQLIIAIVALLSFPIVWLTYHSNYVKSKDQKKKDKINLLNALEIDLNTMKDWLGPYEEKDRNWYRERPKFNAWYLPSKYIYKFSYSSLLDIVKSSYLFSNKLVALVASLNQRISSLHQQLDYLRQFVFAKPDLYQNANLKLSKYLRGNTTINFSELTHDERVYAEHVFVNNYIIHVIQIGAPDREGTIAHEHNKLIQQLGEEIKEIQIPEKQPWFFNLFSITSWSAFVVGLALFFTLCINIFYHLISN